MTTATARRPRRMTRSEERDAAARALRASMAMQSMRSALRELEACGSPAAMQAHVHVKQGLRIVARAFPDDKFNRAEDLK